MNSFLCLKMKKFLFEKSNSFLSIKVVTSLSSYINKHSSEKMKRYLSMKVNTCLSINLNTISIKRGNDNYLERSTNFLSPKMKIFYL